MGLAVLAAIAGAAALGKTVSGYFENKSANKALDALERPDYDIPSTMDQQLSIAQMQSKAEMPGYQARKDSNSTSSANAVSLAKESGNPLLAINAIQSSNNAASRQLQTDKATHKMSTNRDLMGALSSYATFQDRKWQMDEFAPYADEYARLTEKAAAGKANLYGGFNELTSGAFSVASLLG